MKRHPDISLVRPNVRGTGNRVHPPPHLNAKERQLFLELTTNTDPQHFRPQDMPLLCGFVQQACLLDHAVKQMAATGGAVLENGDENPWLKVQTRSLRSMTVLATRLRLSPQSRITQAGAGKRGRPSFYDQMATPPQEDDDNDSSSA